MPNTFSINGTPCSNYGIFVEEYPVEEGGERIVEQVQIPGRTGALTIDAGAVADVTRTYKCMFKGDTGKMRDVKRWLSESAKGMTLTDTYNPGIYRRAKLIKIPDMNSHRNKYARFDLALAVDPRRFFVEDAAFKKAHETWAGTTVVSVVNDGAGVALPKIFFGYTAGRSVSVVGEVFNDDTSDWDELWSFDLEGSEEAAAVYLDSDAGQAYYEDVNDSSIKPAYSMFSLERLPFFPVGTTRVTLTGYAAPSAWWGFEKLNVFDW